jgi:hypothetical protein
MSGYLLLLPPEVLDLAKEVGTVVATAGALGAVVLRWIRGLIRGEIAPLRAEVTTNGEKVDQLAEHIAGRTEEARRVERTVVAMARTIEHIARPGGPLAELEPNGGNTLKDKVGRIVRFVEREEEEGT